MKKTLLFLILFHLSLSARNLSLEEKVGQLLIVHFHGDEANGEAQQLIQNLGVGGFIYYNWANDLTSPEKVAVMSQGLQKLAHAVDAPPLFISVDQEGGKVNRLVQGFTHFPSACAVARTGEPELAYQVALALGQELRAVGINLNYAPDVDVNSEPRNPVIGVRSYGATAEEVIKYAEPTLQGYRESGVLTSLKHYPGHGDVSIDSHENLPTLNKSRDELEKTDLLPFQKLSSQADMIMTGHLLVPALDPDFCVTLSALALGDLRNQGYQGVIISDSLVMEGVSKEPIEEIAIQSFNAGCDLLLLGGKRLHGSSNYELGYSEVENIHQALVEAVKGGRISLERLDQSVERIIELKKKLPKTGAKFDSQAHQLLAEKVAKMALRVRQEGYFTLENKKVVLFVPENLPGIPPGLQVYSGLDSAEGKKFAEGADLVIFGSVDSWKDARRMKFLQSMADKPVLLLVLGDPLDSTLFPALLTIETCSSVEVSVKAAFEELFRRGAPLKISKENAERLGAKIWQNECKQSRAGLLHWHIHEAFPSLGIGHFIWYPDGQRGDFEETFPELIKFLRARGVNVPQEWTGAAPWADYLAFTQETEEKKETLRQFLFETRALQAEFLAQRLENVLPTLLAGLEIEEKNQLCNAFFALLQEEAGVFALIDYLNFKGKGTKLSERYEGQGWGLQQVLLTIPLDSKTQLQDFVTGAYFVLRQRVKNAPHSEERWLAGWLNRVDKYLF